MPLLCRLADSMPDDLVDASILRRHRRRCLRCQAEGVRMRGLRRDLASLRSEVLAAPPGLHAAVMAGLGSRRALRRPVALRRVTRAAAAAGVAAAAVAGGLALRRLRSAS